MPRNCDSYFGSDEYYEDKYYSECRCPAEYYDAEDGKTYIVGGEPSPCLYCKREQWAAVAAAEVAAKAAAEAAKKKCKNAQYCDKIDAIKEEIRKFHAVKTVPLQIERLRCLFTVLLDCEGLLAINPQLRYMTIQKAQEFRKHELAGEQLIELFDHFDALMVKVVARDDFVE